MSAPTPAPRRKRRPIRRLLKWALGFVLVGAIVLLAFVFLGALAARKKPALNEWHTRTLTGEFHAKNESTTTFADYRALEDKLFEQLKTFEITGADAVKMPWAARYIKDSPFNPIAQTHNWNHTTILEPTSGPIKGGALLIHGCSDSPYSLRSIGEAMQANGFYVVCIRLPGHGTIPSGLLNVSWRDWAAATRIAARHVKSIIGDKPFVVGGYSLGGALAIRLGTDAIDDATLPRPDRLFLFSPATGVSPMARLAEVSLIPAVFPYFAKCRWLDICPEYDPYKYNSFTKRAGYETWDLTVRNLASLEKLSRTPQAEPFPPITCFVSAVDATVSNAELLRILKRTKRPGSELVIFDINRKPHLEPFFRADVSVGPHLLTQSEPLPYDFTLVTNKDAESVILYTRTRAAGSPPTAITERDTGLEWPRGILTLAHTAIPFPPNDPFYGIDPDVNKSKFAIGAMDIRAERGALSISEDALMRMRCNPFYKVVEDRVIERLSPPSASAPAPATAPH